MYIHTHLSILHQLMFILYDFTYQLKYVLNEIFWKSRFIFMASSLMSLL